MIARPSPHLVISRSTCVLDALAPGGVVDSQKFNDCMDCWRRFPFKSHLKINSGSKTCYVCVIIKSCEHCTQRMLLILIFLQQLG